MTNTQLILDQPVQSQSEFGLHIEKAIVSLAFDHPELFLTAGRHFSPGLFQSPEAQYVMTIILNALEEYNIVPTRGVARDFAIQHLNTDQPYATILELIDRKSDPRETPIIKSQLIKWLKKKAYGLIYSDVAMNYYQAGDYEALEKIFEEARRITDFKVTGLWLLDDYNVLFNENVIEHRTTGFPKLDAIINNGGPSPGEVVCWKASTNVGKSILLCNNAITSWMGHGSGGRIGQDVLLVSFELNYIKTAMRCLGVMGKDVPIDSLSSNRDIVVDRVEKLKQTYDGKIFISELPPESCSVDHLYALLENLKKNEGWKPDVLIVDYMDLMVSRSKSYNDDMYERQRQVASELRSLAIKEKVVLFTATQNNRNAKDSQDGAVAGLDRVADSYAKTFSMDYIIDIAQSAGERAVVPAILRVSVVKNRNGPKGDTITCEINYNTMLAKEINS